LPVVRSTAPPPPGPASTFPEFPPDALASEPSTPPTPLLANPPLPPLAQAGPPLKARPVVSAAISAIAEMLSSSVRAGLGSKVLETGRAVETSRLQTRLLFEEPAAGVCLNIVASMVKLKRRSRPIVLPRNRID
jgi:hypothetical protein